MKHLMIIGARGWGREVYGMARLLPDFKNGTFDIKGFLDDKEDALDGLRGEYPPIISSVEEYIPQDDDVFFCALGDCHYRRIYAEKILEKGGKFMSLVSPGSWVSPTAKIGVGAFISGWTSISDNVDIGDFTIIHSFVNIGHDVKIGMYNSIESYCFFGGHSQTGNDTTFHVRSSIIPHKRIGNKCSVGFGSVVMRNFGDSFHLFGNPAKKLDF